MSIGKLGWWLIASLVFGVVMGAGVARWWHSAGGTATVKSVGQTASGQKVSEESLNKVVLSETAVRRIGVATARVENRTIPRHRVFGGEVMLPPGKSVVVSAPLAGTIRAGSEGVIQAGRITQKGQPIVSLLPFFSPEAATNLATMRMDVEGQVRVSEAQVTLSKLALARAQRLSREEAGSQRAVEEAQAQHEIAGRTLAAAQERLAILNQALSENASGHGTPIDITAPGTGILRNIFVVPGQSVPSGAPLFEFMDNSQIWIRVPVFAGDIQSIAPNADSHVGRLTVHPGDSTFSAAPVSAPPTASAIAATIDLYYQLSDSGSGFVPGERVAVSVPLTSSSDTLVVPWNSVIHDIHGGTWVYQVIENGTYRRRRVQVTFVSGESAALASGPEAGSSIVTDGAIELFGYETGFTK